MQIYALLPLLAGIVAHALPQENCDTTTIQTIVPTTTKTYSRTAIVTSYPTEAQLVTYTHVSTIKSSTTHFTFTTSATECELTATATVPKAVTTVYPTGYAKLRRRELGLHPRGDCTVTEMSTTNYGQTATYVDAPGQTSTYVRYTAWTQVTVYQTKSAGIAHFIATEIATTTEPCGGATVTDDSWTSTMTMDARCSPSAMISEANGFGLSWLSDTPSSGAMFEMTADSASDCCQQCAVMEKCSGSAWDIRSGACRLEFAADYATGELNCGQSMYAYYDAGPSSPMSPGTGWYVANLCGKASFVQAKPDDGT